MLHSIQSNGKEAPLCVSLIHKLWSVGLLLRVIQKIFSVCRVHHDLI